MTAGFTPPTPDPPDSEDEAEGVLCIVLLSVDVSVVSTTSSGSKRIVAVTVPPGVQQSTPPALDSTVIV